VVVHALWENRIPSVYVSGNEYESKRINIITAEGCMGGDCGVSDPLLQRNARVSK
jgi:hypothetical protein